MPSPSGEPGTEFSGTERAVWEADAATRQPSFAEKSWKGILTLTLGIFAVRAPSIILSDTARLELVFALPTLLVMSFLVATTVVFAYRSVVGY